MHPYVVTKSFIVGEIDKRLLSSQVVFFDGTNLKIGDKSYVAPGLIAAIRSGWLLEATEDQETIVQPKSTLTKEQNNLDSYKVKALESTDSDLPKKKPPHIVDFSNKVISDEDEDNLPLDVALPSIRTKKQAREALQNRTSEEVPDLKVLSDGGEDTVLARQPRKVPNRKEGLPVIEPQSSTGVLEVEDQLTNPKSSETFEVLQPQPTAKEEDSAKKISKRKTAKEVQSEHKDLANQIKAEALDIPKVESTPVQVKVPFDWKGMPFKDRKDFVDNLNDLDVLKQLLLLEKGAVKKFIISKIESLSQNA